MRQPSTLDLSSLFFIPLRTVVPSTPLSRSSPAPTSPHRRPARAIVLSLSFPLGQVRLSAPATALTPAPSLVPVRGVCRISPLPTSTPSRSLPTLLRLLAPPLSPHPLSLFLSFSRVPTSTYHFYAQQCECTTVPISMRNYQWCLFVTYLPSYLPRQLASYLLP